MHHVLRYIAGGVVVVLLLIGLGVWRYTRGPRTPPQAAGEPPSSRPGFLGNIYRMCAAAPFRATRCSRATSPVKPSPVILLTGSSPHRAATENDDCEELSVSDFLETKREEIAARLRELEPLVEEYRQLEAAAAALAGLPGAHAPARAPRRTAARAPRRTAARRRARAGHAGARARAAGADARAGRERARCRRSSS